MTAKGLKSGEELLSYFVSEIHGGLSKADVHDILQYQEVFEAGFRESRTIFHVWKASSPAPEKAIEDITSAGYRVVVSNSNYW